MFRQSLLCHAGHPVRHEWRREEITRLRLAADVTFISQKPDLRSTKVEEFRGPRDSEAATDHPLSKQALFCLTEAWPKSIAFDDLLAAARARLAGNLAIVREATDRAADARELADNMLNLFRLEMISLSTHPEPFVTEAGEFPRASALARWHARRAGHIPDLRMRVATVDGLSRRLLCHLDGHHDRSALIEELVRAVTEDGLVLERFGRPLLGADHVRSVLARELDANLHRLARSALLLA